MYRKDFRSTSATDALHASLMFSVRFATLALLVSLPFGKASAKDIYVSQSGLGSTNSLAWLNNRGNWGTGINLVKAGDTVHFVGTLTNTLTVQGSGTVGNPITFYFEPGAKFSAPTYSGNWINLDGQSRITIDGGGHGVIELTDNGTSVANGGTHTYQNALCAIYGARVGVNNIILENLTIRNLYQRQTSTDAPPNATAIHFIGSGLTYSNLYIDSVLGGIVQSYTPNVTSNMTAVGCTITNYNHGIEIGCGASLNPIILNVLIHGNTFQSGDMFESPNGVELGLHRNGIFLFNESSSGGYNGGISTGYISNIVISCNHIWHGTPKHQSTTAGTGGMFFDTYDSSATIHVRVFNNISGVAAGMAYSGGKDAEAVGTDVLFANNTMIGGSYAWNIGGTNAHAFNNLSVCAKANWISTIADRTGLTNNNATLGGLLSGVWSDYNIFNGMNGYAGWVIVVFIRNSGYTVWSESLYDTLSTFQGACGGLLTPQVEPHSTTVMASLDANYVPLSSDTVARGQGTNLSAFFTTDYTGNPRPATGPWTIGAFEVPGTNQPAGRPSVQLKSSLLSITNGGSITLSWTTLNTTNLTISGLGSVPLTGATNVSPSGATTYTATAFGPFGQDSSSVSIEIKPNPPTSLRVVGAGG
jgi:hypothetical protein